MARKRDYAAEYARRVERARERGYQSYWQERRHRSEAKAAGLPRPAAAPGRQAPAPPARGPRSEAGFATGGTLPSGADWRLAGWSAVGGSAYSNVDAGGPAPSRLQGVDRVTLFVEGVGFRTWAGPFDDEFTLEDAARELEELYG